MSFLLSSSSTALIFSFRNFRCAKFSGLTFSNYTLTESTMVSWVMDLIFACLLYMLWASASTSFMFHCVGPSVGVIALASLGGLPSGVAPPLEDTPPLEVPPVDVAPTLYVLPLVRSLGLSVALSGEVGRVYWG